MFEVHCEYGPVESFTTSEAAHRFCDAQNAKDGEGTYWVLHVSGGWRPKY